MIAELEHNLLFSELELDEIERPREELIKRSSLSSKEFDILLLGLLNYAKVIPMYIIFPYKKRAFEIIGRIDPEDTIFIATVLTFGAIIWSNDKHFKKQNVIKVLTTKEMFRFLEDYK